ncbi:hypothetical protein niasHT_022891 [Heterodera trifolii]|uniref:Uncharacterized protein n=1 Tax=Heterodera trifolii TaxID=157864 RepID=A0ABD2KIL7_9BILA
MLSLASITPRPITARRLIEAAAATAYGRAPGGEYGGGALLGWGGCHFHLSAVSQQNKTSPGGSVSLLCSVLVLFAAAVLFGGGRLLAPPTNRTHRSIDWSAFASGKTNDQQKRIDQKKSRKGIFNEGKCLADGSTCRKRITTTPLTLIG